jgi:hypothetical protein
MLDYVLLLLAFLKYIVMDRGWGEVVRVIVYELRQALALGGSPSSDID